MRFCIGVFRAMDRHIKRTLSREREREREKETMHCSSEQLAEDQSKDGRVCKGADDNRLAVVL